MLNCINSLNIFVGHLHGPDHLSGNRIKVINKSNPAPCPFKITVFLESGHFSSPPPGAAFGQSHLGYYCKNLYTGHSLFCPHNPFSMEYRGSPLTQQPPAFSAPGTDFHGRNEQGGDLLCTLFLSLLHQFHLRSSGIRSWRPETPDLT